MCCGCLGVECLLFILCLVSQNQPGQRRRGIILSVLGRQRLRQAIHQFEAVENQEQPYAAKDLSQRVGISEATMSRIWAGKSGVDRRSLQTLFSTFGLTLTNADYQLPDEVKRGEEAKRLKEAEARLVEQEKRLHQEHRASRLQRWLLGSVSLALIISTGLGLFAYAQKRQSALGEVEALALSSEALFASNKSFDALLQSIRAKERLQSLPNTDAMLRGQVDAAL